MTNRLDLLVAAPANASHLETCLRALARACECTNADALITVAHAGAVVSALQAQFFCVQWIACEPRAPLPQLWGRALAQTNGEWIAILDAECAVGEGWLAAALTRCDQGAVIFGGVVEPRDLRTRTDWAAYCCDYGAFMQPLDDGIAHEVAGNNLLMRRALLSRAPEFAAPQFWKAHFVRALQAQGIATLNAPSLVIHYSKRYALRAWLYRRMIHARCFAAMRVANASTMRRMTFALLAPALPFVLLVRMLRRLLPKRRHARELWSSLPQIWLGMCAWAFGEWCGYIFGAGDSCAQIF